MNNKQYKSKYLSTMVFTDYMKSLPNQQQETIKKLAEVTYSSTSTVYRWISGDIVPPPLKQKVIADFLGVSTEELFPAKNETISKQFN